MPKKLLPLLLLAVLACSKPPPATAFQVTSREQLVGGRRALGDIGDFKISNGVVHAIVQNVGFSRGFGAFGGSLIDVDLVRGGRVSGTQGARGNDWFTEMFPAFFLEAIEPDKVEVVADGKDGGPAIIRVSGRGADFISITKPVNDTLLPTVPLDYQVDYVLEPGKQYLKIVTTMTNPDPDKAAGFPLSIPLGFVTLLGEGQKLFVPGEAGFDMRFHLDEVYQRPAALEALPGVVADYWATEGEGVSYALAASPRGASYLSGNPTYYPGAKRDSLLIPIASSSFLGSFWGKPPPELPKKGGSYTYVGYLAVGQGDVSTAAKVVFDIADEGQRQPTKYGTVSGRVREAGTNAPLDGVSVVLQNDSGLYLGQARTQNGGIYQAVVPPGHYKAWASDGIRTVATTTETVEVSAGGAASLDVQLEQPATLSVMVRDASGRALPSKISVEGVYDYQGDGPPRSFLYNLRVGERLRPSDLDTDQPLDEGSRRYLERIFYAPQGVGTRQVRPGTYKVFASRGPEYDLAVQEVVLEAGKTTQVGLTLNHVLADATLGWVGGDFHVHSIHSVDSPMDLPDRVISYAVEGIDFIAATDHNYVSDFQPTVEAVGLADWLKAGVGLELTSLEMGHFNAFPIQVQPGPVTHGSFGWFRRPPAELFGQLRALGKDPAKTIIQINHPRDSVLGYFNAFNMGTYTTTVLPDTSIFSLDRAPNPDGTMGPYDQRQFSLDFDAIEIFNGKRENMRFSYRIPAKEPTGANPTVPACPTGPQTFDCIPKPGEVLHEVYTVPDGAGGTTKVLQPAYPGALDDWYNLMAKGHRFTAMGNSDSHGKGEEAGLPRTWLAAGASSDGSMRGLSEDAVYDAIRRGHGIVSNGPFVELWVNGEPMGSTVVAPSGEVDVRVRVQAAPWISVNRVVIRRGDKSMVGFPATLAEIPVSGTGTVERLDATHTFKDVPDGSFFVVEVFGDQPMWPVYTPLEVPSILISDAVGVLGGSFGFGAKFGKYRPEQITQVKPYAFTNPVWVDRTLKSALRAPKRIIPVGASKPWTPRRIPDLHRLFGAFHGDVE